MKKVFLLIVVVLLLIYVFAWCIQIKKISTIVPPDYTNITKIILLNGKTGQRVAVENIEKIKEFMSLVESYVVRKIDWSPGVKPGYPYTAKFYTKDNKVFTLSFYNTLGINDEEYCIIKTDLNIEKIHNFIESIENNWN